MTPKSQEPEGAKRLSATATSERPEQLASQRTATGAPGSRPPALPPKSKLFGEYGEEILEEDIISEQSAFPGITGVISGPNARGALKVPAGMQDHLLAVRLTNGRITIAYNPREQAVFQLMRLMRAELRESSMDIEGRALAVTTEVLRQARISAESKSSSNAGNIKSVSAEIFKRWAREANELNATDMHMRVVGGGKGEVLLRINGDLEHIADSKAGLTESQVLDVIKTAYEALADRHSNSDGNFSEHETRSCMIDQGLGIPNLRMRFGSQRGFFGPKATLRLLKTESNQRAMTLAEMGFAPSHQRQFEKAQRLESGIILQCGVTGSGKTTVAKTYWETHPRNGVAAFYQVADPIEYVLRNVHQINVQRSLVTLTESGRKDPYSEVIESLLRMDPDGVDCGELRDVISAKAAASIAKSGHVSLGTLHCSGVMSVVNRLEDIGLSRSDLTSTDMLGMLCYQALVPVLCDNCKLPFEDAHKVSKALEDKKDMDYLSYVMTNMDRLHADTSKMRFRNHEGCSQCKKRGINKLTIVAEMLTPDEKWLDTTSAGKDRAAWRNYRGERSDLDVNSEDMDGKTVMEHHIYKSVIGMVDPRGIERFGDLTKYEVVI